MLRFRPSSAKHIVNSNFNPDRGFPSVATTSNARENSSLSSVVSPLKLRSLFQGNPIGFLVLGLGLPLRPPGRFTPGPTTLNHRLVWDLYDGTRVLSLRGPRGFLTHLGTLSAVTSRSSVFAHRGRSRVTVPSWREPTSLGSRWTGPQNQYNAHLVHV